MGSRMDKYNEENIIPTRSNKNKELYKQVYNAYDEFENLVVPSNAKEITPSDLKKEITSRDEYRRAKEYGDITNNKIVRKEKIIEKQKQENEIYDIKELLNKAVSDAKKTEVSQETLSNGDYLKKLNLDNTRTNIEQVKEIYDEIQQFKKIVIVISDLKDFVKKVHHPEEGIGDMVPFLNTLLVIFISFNLVS